MRGEREEQERLENERIEKEKLEKLRRQKEGEERLKKEQEAARKEKEQQKARQQDVLTPKPRAEPQKPKPKSRKNVFMFAIVLGTLFIGFMMFPPDSGDVAEQTPALSSNQKTYTNSIDMEFVLIPAGEFKMGSPSDEEGRFDNEGPLHTVKIEKAYYLGKYEVTQKQWREVMGYNISNFKGDNLPVEMVSWSNVQEFVRKLNEKEGTDKYRLPSEAEWEYACRAGTTTRYSFGDIESRLGEYAWYSDNSGGKTHSVGQKKPNPWGLYDMHGNVVEWTQDRWHIDYTSAPTDGSAWEIGNEWYLINRGGSWRYDAQDCRSAYRGVNRHVDRSVDLGFRLLQEM